MENPTEIVRIFVKVVQNGSFTRAAQSLRLPKSTVSKAVSKLERDSGTQLLIRTTRSLNLTAAGRAFYETCLPAVQTLEEAFKSLQGRDSIMSGKIKITSPEDLGTFVLTKVIASLTAEHPGLQFELLSTDEIVDLVKEGYDLAVRIGALAESRFRSRRVGEVVLILVASPKYFKSRAMPKLPEDVQKLDCLSLAEDPINDLWTLQRKGQTKKVKVRPRVASNQMTDLLRLAVSGAGVALVPSYLAEPEIQSGKLMRVLPEWSMPGLPVSILTPLSSHSSARLKITVEQIASALRATLTHQKE